MNSKPFLKFRAIKISLLLASLLAATTAFAATKPAAIAAPPPSESGHSPQPKPQIITDEKTNTVHIMIDGEDVVTIDSTGLHINGDVTYTGASSGPRQHMEPVQNAAPPEKPAAK